MLNRLYIVIAQSQGRNLLLLSAAFCQPASRKSGESIHFLQPPAAPQFFSYHDFTAYQDEFLT
jgi:hypothetical protein